MEILLGKIIHRITRDIVRGLREVDESVWRNVFWVIEGRRESRVTVHAGILGSKLNQTEAENDNRK